MTEALTTRPTLRQRLLGVFVLVQLVFIFAMNLLPLLPQGRPDQDEISGDMIFPGRTSDTRLVQDSIELASDGLTRWGELTGQWQGWALFAPMHPEQSVFPLVELRWDEAGARYPLTEPPEVAATAAGRPPLRLHSRFKPADPAQHIRPPDTHFRLFNYEFRMTMMLLFWDADDYQRRPQEWREMLQARVHRQWKSIRAYTRWRMQEYLAEHGDVPMPTQVILLVETYPSLKPGEAAAAERRWQAWPVARWLVADADPDGLLPVALIDPATGDVHRLPVQGTTP